MWVQYTSNSSGEGESLYATEHGSSREQRQARHVGEGQQRAAAAQRARQQRRVDGVPPRQQQRGRRQRALQLAVRYQRPAVINVMCS